MIVSNTRPNSILNFLFMYFIVFYRTSMLILLLGRVDVTFKDQSISTHYAYDTHSLRNRYIPLRHLSQYALRTPRTHQSIASNTYSQFASVLTALAAFCQITTYRSSRRLRKEKVLSSSKVVVYLESCRSFCG